jgi:signal transduction histidine kinase
VTPSPPGRLGDFDLLFEQAPSPSLVLAPDAPRFTIVGVNAAYLRATHSTREGLLGRGLFEAFPDDPADPRATGVRNLRASLERALATRTADTMPSQLYPIPRPEGGFEERHWSPINTPILGEDGRVRLLLHQVEDVTRLVQLTRAGEADRSALGALRAEEVERRALLEGERQARARAEAERRKLYFAFEHADLGIALFRGPQHVIEYANPYELRRVWGRPREAVMGRPVAEALPELVTQGLVAGVCDPVYQTGTPITLTEQPIRLDRLGTGELDEGFFNFVHVPVHDADGRVEGFLAVAWEVTEAVRARARAASLSAQLRERADLERQLLGIVSHDLRNPLNAIRLAATALARRDDLDDRGARTVLRIQSSVERAIRLVGDLLDFTRARLGGGIPVEPGPADLHALTREVVEEVEAAHPGRVVQARGEGDARGVWDAARLSQVVQNLVTNALAYSPEDSTVQVTTRGEDGQVCLCVHNRGAPIPPQTLASLFEPLQRGTTEVGNGGRSVGLGLYIVKHLVDAHGGTIHVTSNAEEGTAFTVRLPRALPGAPGASGA